MARTDEARGGGEPDGPGGTTSLGEIARLFLKLGTTAFGGPAAHVAIMREECVQRRKWLSEERFLDLLGAANLIPGPNSTELAIHIGRERRGGAGLVVAGVSFILPAMLITSALGWAYVRFGRLPETAGILDGVKPVVLVVVLQAVWGLSRTAARTWPMRALGLAAAVAAALGVHELLVLAAAGVIVPAARGVGRAAGKGGLPLLAFLPCAAAAATPVTLLGLFGVFLKTGAVLFGSGYVLIAFLRADLVLRLGWLTEAGLIDAIAVGQVTPGPVFTTATFIGWVLAGPSGALVATAGIFLPAFVFVAASAPFVSLLRRSPAAGAFLDGVNVASLALMAVVALQLARDAVPDPFSLLLAAAAAVLLLRFKVNSAWLVLGGAAAGLAVHA